MDNLFVKALLNGDNKPPEGYILFDSTDHVRFQNGIDVSGHNLGCNRRLSIEKNISGAEGYTVTLFNLDGNHPVWQNNIQMAPKQMKIVSVNNCIVEMRGYGHDKNALNLGAPLSVASFGNYGVALMIKNGVIICAQLNMFDKDVSIVYLQ